MVEIWFDFSIRYKQFKIAQSRETKKMYALRTVSHFPFPRENPRTPRVIEHMEIWGDLEMAEIETKYADDYVVLETKQ